MRKAYRKVHGGTDRTQREDCCPYARLGRSPTGKDGRRRIYPKAQEVLQRTETYPRNVFISIREDNNWRKRNGDGQTAGNLHLLQDRRKFCTVI